MEELKITENFIVEQIHDFLINKNDGNWHKERTRISQLHAHGPDMVLTGGKNNSEKFIIECKGKSYAKSHKSINREGWLNALGQLITRMDTSRVIQTGNRRGEPNRAYKYGLGLCSISADIARRRIPNKIAKILNLYIFSCDDHGRITMYTPSQIGKDI